MERISTSNICNDNCNTPLYFQCMTTISTRIAEARKALNLNQSELARILDVTPQAVQSWESGKARPKGARLENLAKALNKSVEWLMTGKKPLFTNDASKSINEAAEKLRTGLRAMYPTPEAYESNLKNVAQYFQVSQQLKEVDQQLKDAVRANMEEMRWFDKIENTQMMGDILFLTMAAADGVLEPSEVAAIQAIGERLRSLYNSKQE